MPYFTEERAIYDQSVCLTPPAFDDEKNHKDLCFHHMKREFKLIKKRELLYQGSLKSALLTCGRVSIYYLGEMIICGSQA